MDENQIVYFQYLAGEHKGEVVKLSYIDDFLPDNHIAVFDTGDKCSMNLIADINDFNAVEQKKIMARVPNPRNIWTFKTNTPTERTGRNSEGKEFNIVDPYFFDKEGKPTNASKEQAIPPVKVAIFPQIPDIYYTSIAPGPDKTAEKELKTVHIEQIDIPKNTESFDDFEDFEDDDISVNETVQTQQQIVNRDIRVVNNVVLDLDDPNTITGSLVCKYAGELYSLGNIKTFLIDFLSNDDDQVDETPLSCNNKETCKNETVNLLLRDCKTTATDIDLTLTINLPNKSFVDYFCDNYNDDTVNDLFNELVNRIDTDMIRNALIQGLKGYYNDDKSNN